MYIYKTPFILIFVPQRLTLIYMGDNFFHFLNAFQKWYILTEFLIIFMLFISLNKNKASDHDC